MGHEELFILLARPSATGDDLRARTADLQALNFGAMQIFFCVVIFASFRGVLRNCVRKTWCFAW